MALRHGCSTARNDRISTVHRSMDFESAATTGSPGPESGGVMRLCLVEDMAASGLEPLTLTRPVHELLLGATSLGSKLARAFGVGPGPHRRGCMIRSHL